MPQQPSPHEDKLTLSTQFGPNEWLVDELYEQYLKDKNAVDEAWWDFFADYSPADNPAGSTTSTSTGPSGTGSSSAADGSDGAANGHTNGTTATPDSPRPAVPSASRQSPVREPAPVAVSAPAPVAASAPAPVAVSAPTARPATTPQAEEAVARPVEDSVEKLRGPAARVVVNMEESLEVPTATSVRAIPAKLLVDNRIVINNHLKRSRGGKVSFTHLIGYALVEALGQMPSMNAAYTLDDKGKPAVLHPAHVNLGIAIDLPKPDGSRQLMVPAVKESESKDFAEFWSAYEDVVRRARGGKLTADDFAGTTISLTNPGTIGTVHSVPRLVKGQGAIIGVGAMEYPAEYQGASEDTLVRLAVSKVITLTSTYDHRIIQGAGSGEFLRIVHAKLLGEDGFYDRVFQSLHIPYQPIRWTPDISISHDDQINKTARLVELIHAYRVRGHLMADTDPLEYRQRIHPDLEVETHGLTLWDLDREFPTGGFGGKAHMRLRDVLGVLRDSYCRTVGIEYMHIQDPEQRRWIQDRVERPYAKPSAAEQLRVL
ncbi:MAG: 2-oxo acid dehydrogenase subunit E2, partial [Janthinobacterium lividum]